MGEIFVGFFGVEGSIEESQLEGESSSLAGVGGVNFYVFVGQVCSP